MLLHIRPGRWPNQRHGALYLNSWNKLDAIAFLVSHNRCLQNPTENNKFVCLAISYLSWANIAGTWIGYEHQSTLFIGYVTYCSVLSSLLIREWGCKWRVRKLRYFHNDNALKIKFCIIKENKTSHFAFVHILIWWSITCERTRYLTKRK